MIRAVLQPSESDIIYTVGYELFTVLQSILNTDRMNAVAAGTVTVSFPP